jgi:pimeloyl-ACP methyl ester carboxylesterase
MFRTVARILDITAPLGGRVGAALLVLVVVLAVATGLLWWSSPGTPTPYVDGAGRPIPGSLSEKSTTRLNGVEQGMFLKGRDARRPVLLYLHGGMPDYFLTTRYPTGLDDHFVVVWWEQRGSGMSYDPGAPAEAVTAEQLVSDTLELARHLRQRFGQQKVYLVGHSGGTFIGIQAAARAPELFHAYVGIAQMSNQLESERLAHAYMTERYRRDGQERMARRLEAAPVGEVVPLSDAYLRVRDVAMHGLGVGTTHDMTSLATGLVWPSLQAREYTPCEKVRLWRAKITAGQQLWNTQLATDLTRTVTRLEVPTYFVHGVHDYTVSYPLAHAYFERLSAPVKGFYTFTQSAHSPLFEEPERMRRIMVSDVLTGTNELADRE